MSKQVRNIIVQGAIFLLLLNLLNSSLVASELIVTSHQPPPIYGYRVGDHYKFVETVRETLNSTEFNLLWESRHESDVVIQEIRENVGRFHIRITARVTAFVNISYDFSNYSIVRYFEGYRPIVDTSLNYFTHTEWQIHLIDWNQHVESWQGNTNLVGYREQDLDDRYFYFNFTQWFTSNQSAFDIDNDGEMDSYHVYNTYTARYNPDGVILLRRFYSAMHFDCGINHSRLRKVEQILPETDISSSIPPVVITWFVAGITCTCFVLFAIVILTQRRRRR